MPKNKTHSGASKRFKVTGIGQDPAARRPAGVRRCVRVRRPPPAAARSTAATPGWSSSRRPTSSAPRSCSVSEPRSPDPDPTHHKEHEDMARVKRAVNAQKKRRTTLERASGYRGQRSRLYRKAKEQVTHSLVYSYNDRRKNKGNFRRLWIQRINAGGPRPGDDLQPVHPGPRPGRRRGRPQDPGRPGRQRHRGVQRAGRGRQGRPPRGRQRAPRPRPTA